MIVTSCERQECDGSFELNDKDRTTTAERNKTRPKGRVGVAKQGVGTVGSGTGKRNVHFMKSPKDI